MVHGPHGRYAALGGITHFSSLAGGVERVQILTTSREASPAIAAAVGTFVTIIVMIIIFIM